MKICLIFLMLTMTVYSESICKKYDMNESSVCYSAALTKDFGDIIVKALMQLGIKSNINIKIIDKKDIAILMFEIKNDEAFEMFKKLKNKAEVRAGPDAGVDLVLEVFSMYSTLSSKIILPYYIQAFKQKNKVVNDTIKIKNDSIVTVLDEFEGVWKDSTVKIDRDSIVVSGLNRFLNNLMSNKFDCLLSFMSDSGSKRYYTFSLKNAEEERNIDDVSNTISK